MGRQRLVLENLQGIAVIGAILIFAGNLAGYSYGYFRGPGETLLTGCSIFLGPLAGLGAGLYLLMMMRANTKAQWIPTFLKMFWTPFILGIVLYWGMNQMLEHPIYRFVPGVVSSLTVGFHLWFWGVLGLGSVLLGFLGKLFRNPLVMEQIERMTDQPIWLFSPFIDLWIVAMLLNPFTVYGTRAFGGWNILAWMVFILYGALYLGSDEILLKIKELRYKMVFLGGCCVGALYVIAQMQPIAYGWTTSYAIAVLFQSLGGWGMAVGAIGFLQTEAPWLLKIKGLCSGRPMLFFWFAPWCMLALKLGLNGGYIPHKVLWGAYLIIGFAGGYFSLKAMGFVKMIFKIK